MGNHGQIPSINRQEHELVYLHLAEKAIRTRDQIGRYSCLVDNRVELILDQDERVLNGHLVRPIEHSLQVEGSVLKLAGTIELNQSILLEDRQSALC